MKKNIFLALDFNSADKALEATNQTRNYLAGIKIGLELYSQIGLKGIKEFEQFKLPQSRNFLYVRRSDFTTTT